MCRPPLPPLSRTRVPRPRVMLSPPRSHSRFRRPPSPRPPSSRRPLTSPRARRPPFLESLEKRPSDSNSSAEDPGAAAGRPPRAPPLSFSASGDCLIDLRDCVLRLAAGVLGRSSPLTPYTALQVERATGRPATARRLLGQSVSPLSRAMDGDRSPRQDATHCATHDAILALGWTGAALHSPTAQRSELR